MTLENCRYCKKVFVTGPRTKYCSPECVGKDKPITARDQKIVHAINTLQRLLPQGVPGYGSYPPAGYKKKGDMLIKEYKKTF